MRVAETCCFARPLVRTWLADGVFYGLGWHEGSETVWSRDRVATLAFSAQHFPQPVPVVLTVMVFGAEPDETRHIGVISPGHAPSQVAVSTPQPVKVMVMTPEHQPGEDFTSITLELDSLTSPTKLGQSADDRLLGLTITEVDFTPIMLGGPLDITADPGPGDAARISAVLPAGWAAPEPGNGVWMLGSVGHVHLPGHLRPATGVAQLTLTANALPRGPDHPPMIVTVAGGGRKVHTQLAEMVTEITVPLVGWTQNRDLTLHITADPVLSPQDLGINADARPLGVLLKGISLTNG